MLKDYTDELGFKHRVFIPDTMPDLPPQLGVEMSLDFEMLAAEFGIPPIMGAQVQAELWEQGIITSDDYLKDNIHAIVGSALRRIIKVEANAIVNYVRRSLNNASG